MSKLWILRPAKDLPDTGEGNPWFALQNMVTGMIVAADTEEAARQVAADNAGAEKIQPLIYKDRVPNPWQEERLATCEPLVATDFDGLVMQDFLVRP